MQFRQSTISALAVAILASSSVATPLGARSNDSESHTGSPTSTLSTVTIPIPTGAPSAGATAQADGLSKTQQILLSDTRADALNNVLTDDKADFVFDFNAKRVASPPGAGGEIVTANRKTFPVSESGNGEARVMAIS